MDGYKTSKPKKRVFRRKRTLRRSSKRRYGKSSVYRRRGGLRKRRRGGYGRKTFHKGYTTLKLQYRVTIAPHVVSSIPTPIGLYFNWNFYNLGYNAISPNSSVTPDWNYSQDNFYRLRPYLDLYRDYRVSKVQISLQDLVPNLKFNAIRVSNSLGSSPQTYGYWICRSDPTAQYWRHTKSYRDLIGLKGNNIFVPGNSQRLLFNCRPRHQNVSASYQTVLVNPSNEEKQEQVSFTLDGTSRKFKPTTHASFNPVNTTIGAENDIVRMQIPRPARTYDYTTWNGVYLQYFPPIDYQGLEYGMTGYDPLFANAIPASIVATFTVSFQFRGKMPHLVANQSDYPHNRGYQNVMNLNLVEKSFV